jgi:hypothetical protein
VIVTLWPPLPPRKAPQYTLHIMLDWPLHRPLWMPTRRRNSELPRNESQLYRMYGISGRYRTTVPDSVAIFYPLVSLLSYSLTKNTNCVSHAEFYSGYIEARSDFSQLDRHHKSMSEPQKRSTFSIMQSMCGNPLLYTGLPLLKG